MSHVTYDHRAIKIDGSRTMLLTGSIHYPRSTPGMWPDLMKKSRDAGLTAIDTYVFWNLHERTRGVYDFRDRLDLTRFCEIAHENGLKVVLRIGPYICAETNYGGLPAWLREVPKIQMRTDNEPFKREMERWVRLLCDMLKPQFAPNGGPIVLAQLENEFANIAKNYGPAGQRYLEWVANLGASIDIGVPWVMCSGSAPGIIETINEGMPHRKIDEHYAAHPQQPAYCTELYPGWYDVWGAPRCTRSPENVAYAAARFIAAGGCGVTYYMWHGGTNFDREAIYLQTTSYDFGAPLDEYGQRTTKLEHLGRLHRLLLQWSDCILSQDRPEPILLGAEQKVYAYGKYSDGIAFVCNDSNNTATVEYSGQSFQLAPASVVIISGARVLFDTAFVAEDDRLTRVWTPVPGTMTCPACWSEPTPSGWPADLKPTALAADPVEQLRHTGDRTDYCWYSTDLDVKGDEHVDGVLTLDRVADIAHVFIDGALVATTPAPLSEDRGRIDSDAYRQSFHLRLSPGRRRLEILCCAVGLIKGDWMLGEQNMANERKGLWGTALWNGDPLNGPWEMRSGLVGERVAIFADGQALVKWIPPDAATCALTWVRLEFDRPSDDDPLALDLGGMSKGIAWLNGRCIGRFWQVPAVAARQEWLSGWAENSTDPVQRYYHLPKDWLQEHNTVVLLDELKGDPASVELCRVSVRPGRET